MKPGDLVILRWKEDPQLGSYLRVCMDPHYIEMTYKKINFRTVSMLTPEGVIVHYDTELWDFEVISGT
jgi:hypothetical protein